MRAPLTARFAAAAVLLAAAGAALAGCGSGGHADAHGSARPSAAVSAPGAAPSATASAPEPLASAAPGIGPDGTAESGGPAAGSGKMLPKSQLTPATGTFTAKQREYLVGKVPVGMDPAAVLQTGQESCDRIANTADSDPKLARQAIASGQIADAKDAVRFLCPKYQSLLH